MHGLALNVRPDLAHFEHIVPCGIADRPVSSMQVSGGEPSKYVASERRVTLRTPRLGVRPGGGAPSRNCVRCYAHNVLMYS